MNAIFKHEHLKRYLIVFIALGFLLVTNAALLSQNINVPYNANNFGERIKAIGHRFSEILSLPTRIIVEIGASIEVIWNLGAIRDAELRYVSISTGHYVTDGLPWGTPFRNLDINPNKHPRRKWDYRVIARGATFKAEAKRRDGDYARAVVSFSEPGKWEYRYSFWFFRVAIKFFTIRPHHRADSAN